MPQTRRYGQVCGSLYGKIAFGSIHVLEFCLVAVRYRLPAEISGEKRLDIHRELYKKEYRPEESYEHFFEETHSFYALALDDEDRDRYKHHHRCRIKRRPGKRKQQSARRPEIQRIAEHHLPQRDAAFNQRCDREQNELQ